MTSLLGDSLHGHVNAILHVKGFPITFMKHIGYLNILQAFVSKMEGFVLSSRISNFGNEIQFGAFHQHTCMCTNTDKIRVLLKGKNLLLRNKHFLFKVLTPFISGV